ncbi:MAG TPA: prephenate dehydrogenase [Anaerolineales bacterium]|nr:prephenate dehydrogenase [Anaerolineales bacterium]
MNSQITIIGLGQIGASIGLALRGNKNVKRVGYDKDVAVSRAAQSLEVVDEIKNLPAAVKDAALVVLCLPLSEIRETLRHIGPWLADNTLIMDTAPVKSGVISWVKELIPPDRFYVGLVPAIGSHYIASLEFGLNAAQPDLFQKGIMVVDVPQGIPEEIVNRAFDFCHSLGAKPMLFDILESDGLMTSVHVLPQLTAAALLNATIGLPGWQEARKLAGRPFAGVTSGMAYHDNAQSLQEAVLANRASAVHALETLMAALQGLRDDIEQGNEAGISERLSDSVKDRETWLDERGEAPWLQEGGDAMEAPRAGEQIMQTLFGSRIIDRNKKKK